MPNLSFLPIALAAIGMSVVSTVFNPVEAASFTFSVDEFTGDDTRVDFWLEDIDGGVRILASIDTTGGNVSGDISGIWFNLADDSGVGRLDIQGPDITAEQQSMDGVGDLGGGVNFKGGGSQTLFDVGIKLGRNGNDDITQTSFIVLGEGLTVESFFEQLFAVRIKSSDGAEGSSKLQGEAPDAPPNKSRGWNECGQGDHPLPCQKGDRDTGHKDKGHKTEEHQDKKGDRDGRKESKGEQNPGEHTDQKGNRPKKKGNSPRK